MRGRYFVGIADAHEMRARTVLVRLRQGWVR
jgi:hypothetical protein